MRRIKDIAFVLFCALVVGCSILPQYREYRELNQKYTQLQSRCEVLESENRGLQRENVRLLNALAARGG